MKRLRHWKLTLVLTKTRKIVNVMGIGADSRFNGTLRGVMRSPDDPRLDFLIELADMADKMTNTATKRIQHLTRDTGRALSHVCRGLVDLTRNLLKCGNAYVILGWFTTDPLEKSFSKLRQGSGGTYFITVQSVIEKV